MKSADYIKSVSCVWYYPKSWPPLQIYLSSCTLALLNTLRPRQIGRLFADDTFKRIFLNENVGISIEISLKFGHKDPINNIPALVHMMAWRRPGDKPLSEPMVVRLPTHLCVTRPQLLLNSTRHNFIKAQGITPSHKNVFMYFSTITTERND